MRKTGMGLWAAGIGMAVLAGCVAVEPGGGQGAAPMPAPPPTPSPSCLAVNRPVCGRVGNLSPRTYGNVCAARAAGATIISQGQCPLVLKGKKGTYGPHMRMKAQKGTYRPRLKGYDE